MFTFCCFNGVARDYARFGQLVLQDGKWGEKQIVSSNYVYYYSQVAGLPYGLIKDLA